MNITIKKIKELPDGSAEVNVHYDLDGLQFLVEQGLKATMVEAIMQQATGELYGISDILGTLPQKGSKRRSNKSMAKIKPGGTD